jgi:hypothetical protein
LLRTIYSFVARLKYILPEDRVARSGTVTTGEEAIMTLTALFKQNAWRSEQANC